MPSPTDPAPASAPEPMKCPKCGAGPAAQFTLHHCMVCDVNRLADMTDRAESAESERDALRAAVARLEGELAETKQVGVGVLGMLDRGIVPEEYEEQFAAIRLMVHAFFEGDAALTTEAAEKALLACSEYRDANQRLTAALAGSVPKAVALRACELSHQTGAQRYMQGEEVMRLWWSDCMDPKFDWKGPLDYAAKLLPDGCAQRSSVAALARALREAEAEKVMAAHGVIQIGTSSGRKLSPEAKIAICEKALPIAHKALAESATRAPATAPPSTDTKGSDNG